MDSPFGPGCPPLRFASALRAASRWSAWLPFLLHLTLRPPHGQPLPIRKVTASR
ncbi:hypothetical protein [Hymenobacter sp.]|uniref:hypothetical protein n=1 Tax=Hymenobacter sp. TaxID=1898978 RepID=UPI002ED7DB07